MILRLNKLKKKNVIIFCCVTLFILSICFSIPSTRGPFLNLAKLPLNFLTFLQREAGALIFFHRNYAQLQTLKIEVGVLQNKLDKESEISQENQRLKNLLGFKQQSPYKLIAAKIIAHSPDNWSSSIIIDKGRNKGIRKGMPVISFAGLVGRVVETTDVISKVMLITDPNLNVSCIDQRSRQEGLVSGTLGANLIMKYLPQDSDIKIEDKIVTSGLNASYPKGIALGIVVSIGNEFSGLSRFALVKPAVNLSSLEEVLVIYQ